MSALLAMLSWGANLQLQCRVAWIMHNAGWSELFSVVVSQVVIAFHVKGHNECLE
jgi:hypothetical protein